MANSFSVPEEFTFYWKVTHFDACFLHNHEAFDSPSFSLKNFCNTRWYLRLYLESHRKYGFEYVCALVREYDEGPSLIGVFCKVSCDSETIAEDFQTFTKGSKYDIKVPDLYDFDKFPQMNSLLFKCEMYFNSGDETLLYNSNLPNSQPCYLKPCLEVLRDGGSANFTSADKRIYTCPRRGFGFSRYLVERRTFILPFHDLQMQKIVSTSFTETPSLCVEFRVVSEDDFDYLKINFFLVDTRLKSNLLLYSEVSFVDSNSEIIDSGKDYHLFRRNHADGGWSFGHFFDWSEIKERKSTDLFLSCNLHFFDGKLQSEVLWMADVVDYQQPEPEWISASCILDQKTLDEDMSLETVYQTETSLLDKVIDIDEYSDHLESETIHPKVRDSEKTGNQIDGKKNQTKPLFKALSPGLNGQVSYDKYSDHLESEIVFQKARDCVKTDHQIIVDGKKDQTKSMFKTLSPGLDRQVCYDEYSDHLESETVHPKERDCVKTDHQIIG